MSWDRWHHDAREGEAPDGDDDPGRVPDHELDALYATLHQLDAMRGVTPTHRRCRHQIDETRADCGVCLALDIMLDHLEMGEP